MQFVCADVIVVLFSVSSASDGHLPEGDPRRDGPPPPAPGRRAATASAAEALHSVPEITSRLIHFLVYGSASHALTANRRCF
ncbi:hypothetical protein ANCDUO_14899 [Ancylostoma duodenale]|uniref:Secreted protein n=1 Tax=Ancylostoma duodenale TaxID=51022 RepID=A0A0C2CF50_9BILA|nr:hypothetical protein ANCDUO_14899 [Ancylostoma duodenale]